MSSEGSEPVGSPVKVVKVCFAYVVKPFTGEVVKVCSGPYPDAHLTLAKILLWGGRGGSGSPGQIKAARVGITETLFIYSPFRADTGQGVTVKRARASSAHC